MSQPGKSLPSWFLGADGDQATRPMSIGGPLAAGCAAISELLGPSRAGA